MFIFSKLCNLYLKIIITENILIMNIHVYIFSRVIIFFFLVQMVIFLASIDNESQDKSFKIIYTMIMNTMHDFESCVKSNTNFIGRIYFTKKGIVEIFYS